MPCDTFKIVNIRAELTLTTVPWPSIKVIETTCLWRHRKGGYGEVLASTRALGTTQGVVSLQKLGVALVSLMKTIRLVHLNGVVNINTVCNI